MQVLAVLCLAAAALARPQTPITTVTERTLHLQDNADKYYGQSYYGPSAYSAYHAAAVPVVSSVTAAPVEYHHAAVTAAPVAYHHAAVTAAPVTTYHAAAVPAVTTYNTAYPAYNTAYNTAYHTAALPAVAAYNTAYHAAAVPAVTAYTAPYAYNAGYYRTDGISYDDTFHHDQVYDGPAKVYKHVYAFAAPEEPATRAHVSIQAPVNKRKHYKLVFIKAPSQQTVVDSDITLPAQEEEKTLIYVLSKNQKQVQPEIRVKQEEASKHAKPEVFFLKYRNEAEAQAIANGAISGENANVPVNGEIISDGSVSLLGQTDSAFRAGFGGSNILYHGAFAKPIVAAAPVVPAVPAVPAVSQYSVGSVGIVPTAVPTVVSTPAPVTIIGGGRSVNYGNDAVATSFGLNNGYAFQSRFEQDQDPASVALKVTSEPASAFEPTTSSPVEA